MEQRTYSNLFAEMGYDKNEIEARLNHIFEEIFYGKHRFYHEFGDDMGYMEDTGNEDTRTEGISYGMMVCVQLDRQKEFNRLWKWAKEMMFLTEGENAGYFAWSVSPKGEKNSYGAAPDGEEFFVMALFFASHRWGDGEGIYQYSKEAKDLLHTMIWKEQSGNGRSMFDPKVKQIRFIAERDFTDPSYHLPHFYELWSEWAYEEDRAFMKEVTEVSRDFLAYHACHKETGLSAEYSYYDGTPYEKEQEIFGRHDWYFSDAYRTIANIALDYEWFAKNNKYKDAYTTIANNLQRFFCETMKDNARGVYLVDGTPVEGGALHSVAITAVNAQASLASNGAYRRACVEAFWNAPLREDKRRYYDNFLYLFAFLALSGNYRIW